MKGADIQRMLDADPEAEFAFRPTRTADHVGGWNPNLAKAVDAYEREFGR